MTTFRLARSPTASLVGTVRGNTSFSYPSGGGGGGGGLPSWLVFPTQVDEQLMYDNVLNWAWIPADKATTFATTPPSSVATQGHASGGGSVHNNSEADDLWNHYVMYKRTKDSNPAAAAIYLAWAQAWRDYFCIPGLFEGNSTGQSGASCTTFGDHMYGWGLVLWGIERNDTVAKQRAIDLITTIESASLACVPGSTNMSLRESRRRARALILACYVTMMDPSTRWLTMRNHLIDCWVTSTGWHDTTHATWPTQVGGNHFCGRPQSTSEDFAGWMQAQYDQGIRWNHSFMYGLHTEALWLAYKLTGRSDVRDMLIKMARFVLHYAWDPLHVNAMAGSRWGYRPLTGAGAAPAGMGSPGFLHDHEDEFLTSAPGVPQVPFPPLWTDPNSMPTSNYEISLVGGLVRGYQLTGEVEFLDRAKAHLRQATVYANATVQGTPKLAANEVHHYLDSQRTSADPIYFNWNKGEFQYSYAICENGGVPAIESAWPPYAVPSQPGQVIKIAGDAVPTSQTVTHTGNDVTGSTFPTNVFADVRPSEVGGALPANQMLYGGDTRTKFIESFSRGGAVVIAGSGGHHGTINFGACLFDFEDGRWKRIWTHSGNPGVDNIAGNGSNPIDVRTGTKIHGCANFEDDLYEWYVGSSSGHGGFTGPCWAPSHWATMGMSSPGYKQNVPVQADPKQQYWEVSRMEGPPGGTGNWGSGQDTVNHGWPFPGEFGGDVNGRFTDTGYVTPSLPGSARNPPWNPPVAGTLEPTQSELPGPSHVWDHFYELKPSEGGGPKGSIVCGRQYNIGHSGTTNLSRSHRFDLHTGIWHIFSVNSPSSPASPTPPAGGNPLSQPSAISSAEDPVTRRVYLIAKELNDASGRVNYMNLSDRTWRNFAVGSGGITPQRLTEYMVVDPVRRLLIVIADTSPHLAAVDLQTLGTTNTPEPTPSHALGGWRVIPYDDIPGQQSVPPFVSSTTAASAFPHGGQVRMPWRYYPPNGKFYRVNPNYVGGGFQAPLPSDLTYQITVLQRLTPPPVIATPRPDFYYTTEASSGRWTLDEITLDSPLPVPDSQVGYAACGFSFFHYVPSLQCMAFLPCDQGSLPGRSSQVRRCVYLIKPE